MKKSKCKTTNQNAKIVLNIAILRFDLKFLH